MHRLVDKAATLRINSEALEVCALGLTFDAGSKSFYTGVLTIC